MNKVRMATAISSVCIVLLSACSKKPENTEQTQNTVPATDQDSLGQLKLDTVKKMYAENLKHQSGNETLYRYATDHFKSLMDLSTDYTRMHHGICGYDEDLLMNSQDPDYSQTEYQYAVNPNGQVVVKLPSKTEVTFALQCQDNNCQINDVLHGDASISKTIETECVPPTENESAVAETEVPAYADYKLSYRFDSKTENVGNQFIHVYDLVITSESDDPINISYIKVNRGNCPLSLIDYQNPVLKFGQTYKVRIRCNPQDVKEVNLIMGDGQELTMKPNSE
ncbi:hypothetical protein N5J44_06170 [Acinetobacter ursingii]|uniref:hypothetical protein n=1 Tax=Acinetobacter ursingii TaxID=108980 RepID=UPI002449F414|nr:hypothetical protein [Acinetobacter ursingii]MDH2018891.1 hypothetical protein [Acinetobacter ursingii]MDH2071136.1 hypothetical protein [Acinetobacter ursingii]